MVVGEVMCKGERKVEIEIQKIKAPSVAAWEDP